MIPRCKMIFNKNQGIVTVKCRLCKNNTYSGTYTIFLLNLDNLYMVYPCTNDTNIKNAHFHLKQKGCYRIEVWQDDYPFIRQYKYAKLYPNRNYCFCFPFCCSMKPLKTNFSAKVTDKNYKNLYFKGVEIKIGYKSSSNN